MITSHVRHFGFGKVPFKIEMDALCTKARQGSGQGGPSSVLSQNSVVAGMFLPFFPLQHLFCLFELLQNTIQKLVYIMHLSV